MRLQLPRLIDFGLEFGESALKTVTQHADFTSKTLDLVIALVERGLKIVVQLVERARGRGGRRRGGRARLSPPDWSV